MAASFTGVHHLKFPVTDLERSAAWFEGVLGATRERRFDHHDGAGELFAVILLLPGIDVPVELRRAPDTARAVAGFDPVTFGVADRAALDAWVAHLDAAGVAHSPVISGFIGELVELTTPDGMALRLYTDPPGGFAAAEMDAASADVDSPWLNRREVRTP
jgi:catechol 2,3-dioxygenase-like lactoylglutathione lyase family enzyme